ncbi:CPBP family intramembrane glutamic endopeptidase, partial [Xanthomonas euvesicatoria]|uniref:CPBP family intramembrane glutamic endopeptidase n=1 Tax=Xanthomonas euvesicatoria TaxID=456327 RepID=UPI001E2C952F
GENLFDLLMAQSSQSVEPPQNPGRFSVVFGAMHASQGISGIALTGIVGAAFGYAYLRSNRNLLALILAHGLVDTWGVTTLYLGWY